MSKKDQTTIVKTESGTHILKEGGVALVTFKAESLTPGVGTPAKKATKAKDTVNTGSRPWSSWGDNDRYPQDFLDKIGKLGVAEGGIDINADLHYGAGIKWFKEEVTDDGKIILKPVLDPTWNEFKRSTNYNVVHSNMCQSLETLYIAWIEFVLTKPGVGGKRTISSLQCLDSSFCRLKKKDESGKITHLYYVHDMNTGGTVENADEIPFFDPEKPFQHDKFVIQVKYDCLGMPYYAMPNLNTAFRNGWADIAIEVPKFLKALYRNQATLKYHIIIPLTQIIAENPKYWELGDKKQMEIQLAKRDEIDAAITSSDNAGKSIFSVFDDRNDGEKHVEIKPIGNLLDSKSELPNNAAANSEMLFAMGVDPSLIGLGTPGGKDLSGSGSDKRESRENKQSNLHRERLVSLQLPEFIHRYFLTDMPRDIFPNYIDVDNSQTLDENPTGKQTITT